MAIGGAWIKAICVIICAAVCTCAHVRGGIIMHLDDRWLSGGERRHVSKADPWLDDGLGTIAGMFCPPLSIQICKIRYTNTNTG